MACQIEEKREGESKLYRSVVNYERLSEIFEFKGEQLNKPENEGAQDTGKGSLFLFSLPCFVSYLFVLIAAKTSRIAILWYI